MSARGTGRIYQRGKIWWVEVYVDGERVQKSSGSTIKDDAKKLRDSLLGLRAAGNLTPSRIDKITCGQLLDDYLRTTTAKSKRIPAYIIEAHLRPVFEHVPASKLTTAHLYSYRDERKIAGIADATVNRELGILRNAFNQARRTTPPLVSTVPYFPMVKETNIRQGFLEDADYPKLRDALPGYLKPVFVTAYYTGIRKGELLKLRWSQVDFESGLITLRHGETKNQEGRVVPIFDGDMRASLETAAQVASGEYVFTRDDGELIQSFRKAWDAACKEAGVGKLHFHSLRRTAVRNLRRSGVDQAVRMKIGGWKTTSMERRYQIVDTADMIEAVKKRKELDGK